VAREVGSLNQHVGEYSGAIEREIDGAKEEEELDDIHPKAVPGEAILTELG